VTATGGFAVWLITFFVLFPRGANNVPNTSSQPINISGGISGGFTRLEAWETLKS